MPDLIDQANDHIQRELDALLINQSERAAARAGIPTANGQCQDCGDDIGEARRKALPHTGRCIDCARIAEIHYREYAWRSR